jgi:cytochrome c-type biogenesis protein CcmH
MIWFVMTAMVAIALVMVLRPFFDRPSDDTPANKSLAVYRDQLAEVDADLERGLISAPEAEAARLEIKRRILALDTTQAAATATGTSRTGAIVTGGVVAALSVGLYLYLGKPMLPGHPYRAEEEQTAMGTAAAGEVEGMIAKLQQHLKDKPDDLEGWRALGWAQMQIGRSQAGVDALRKAAALAPTNASVLAMLGEAMVRQAEGDVTDEALSVFDRVLAIAPKDPRARFYKGLHLSRNNQDRAALDLWIDVIKDGPADAEWIPSIRQQAKDLAQKMGVDPATVP